MAFRRTTPPALAPLVPAIALLLASAASAQEGGAAEKRIAAAARFEERDGAVQDAAILTTLDTLLWSTLSGRQQSRIELVRLPPASPAGCGLRCALEAARAAGATFLIRGEAQRVDDRLLANIEIVSVETGAVMQSHRSGFAAEPAALVETTVDAIRRAADNLFEGPAPTTTPPKVKKPIIAVAHLADAVPALLPESFAALDEAMYSAIAGLGQTRYQIGRLAAQDDPCDLTCAIAVAKAAGATYVLWSAIERDADQMRVVASLASTSSGSSIRAPRSAWVTEFRHLQRGVDQVSREIAGMLVRSTKPVSGPYGASYYAGTDGNGGDVVRAMAQYRENAFKSPAYAEARAGRNAGVTLFILGVLLNAVGGGLIGAGQPAGNNGLIVPGYVLGGVGVLMFISGLPIWVSNQVRMNKLERGIPLGRRLTLEGLSPVVAARDRGAPGLGAAFSF